MIDGHAHCTWPNPKDEPSAQHPGDAIKGILSYGACYSEVKTIKEDTRGFFRTEVRSTVENLKVEGDYPLSADRITTGLVTVYRRQWYEERNPPVSQTRVLPIDCTLGSLSVNGRPANTWLPAPFHYDQSKREDYLHAEQPDPAIEAEVQQAMAGSASRSVKVPNFGTIYFGEWVTAADAESQHVPQLTMLRLAMGSPVGGHMMFAKVEDGGRPDPP